MDLESAQKLLSILLAKCPTFSGLLRIVCARLFLYDPLCVSWNTKYLAHYPVKNVEQLRYFF